jgi:hypothetical protein
MHPFGYRGPATSAAAVLALVGLAFGTSGCPEEAGTPCSDYEPPPGFDPSKPAVSFSRDVMPVITQSCAFSTCHGSNIGPANGVFLGRDPARVHAAIVGVKAGELPAMPFVTPGNPRESFLMRKIDGSQCVLDDRCKDGDCGDSMPKNTSPLEVERRDIVRRWIAQGAKND